VRGLDRDDAKRVRLERPRALGLASYCVPEAGASRAGASDSMRSKGRRGEDAATAGSEVPRAWRHAGPRRGSLTYDVASRISKGAFMQLRRFACAVLAAGLVTGAAISSAGSADTKPVVLTVYSDYI